MRETTQVTGRNSSFRRRPWGAAAVMCLAVFAAGCSSKNKDDVARGPACPGVGILADASRLVQFAGTEAGGSGILFSAEIVNAAATCDYSRRYVDMALSIQVHARHGQAGGTGVYPSRYFVAVVDPGERILARDIFDLAIAFEAGQPQAVLRDTVDRVRIPLKQKKAGAGYQIIVGFELTPDQVIYNRVTAGTSQSGS